MGIIENQFLNHMKKILFATLCFACLTATGIYAQKGKGNAGTEVGSTGGSNAREGRNVGKGSPLLQRQAGSSNGEGSSDVLPANKEAAPAAPAAASSPAAPSKTALEIAPSKVASPVAPAENKNVAPASNAGEKPKE
jgi:hypothetical protein